MNAAVFLRRQQHPRVTRMQRKRQHLAANGGDLQWDRRLACSASELARRVIRSIADAADAAGTAALRFQRAQIRQQFLRVRERNFVRLFQPAELPQILHAGRFQRQHHFGQIEPLDFRQFLRRAMRVFVARPKPHANARRGAAGAARALVGVGLRDFFDEQRVDAAIGVVAGECAPGRNQSPAARRQS